MINKGIMIKWDTPAEEYIEIDISSKDSIPIIKSTLEYWLTEKKCVKYFTTSECRRLNSGALEIIINYEKSINEHLHNVDGVRWGRSIIKLSPNEASGKATWYDADSPEYNGTVDCFIIDNQLIGEKKRRRVSQIQRDQERFRTALIALDECCVISGENTLEALEAAHIIPASEGGNEVVENGILLRADLHRLLDKGMFVINGKGEIQIDGDLSESYMILLNQSKINGPAYERVKVALQKMTEMHK